MEVSSKPQRYVSTDEDISSPVSPTHQETPVRTKQRPGVGVSTTSQGIAAGEFGIGQRDQQGYSKGKHKGQERSRPRTPSGCTDQNEDAAANRTANAKCYRLTQC